MVNLAAVVPKRPKCRYTRESDWVKIFHAESNLAGKGSATVLFCGKCLVVFQKKIQVFILKQNNNIPVFSWPSSRVCQKKRKRPIIALFPKSETRKKTRMVTFLDEFQIRRFYIRRNYVYSVYRPPSRYIH